MKRLLTVLSFLTVLFCARAAFALDMEYYTYGGFAQIVGAFTKLALIFSDGGFSAAIYVAMVVGILFGGIALVMRAVGGRFSTLSWGVPLMAGYLVYAAMIVPQGTLYIYDPVANRNQAVGGIPDGIVAIAGTMNLIEQYMVNTIYTASDPLSYQTMAGGRGFNLMYDIAQSGGIPMDADLAAYLKNYINDCVMFELQRPGTTLTVNELASTTNFIPLLNLAASPSIYTVAFPGDTTVDCKTASTYLDNQLTSSASYTEAISDACSNAGYNVSNAAELAMCTDTLETLMTSLSGNTYAISDIFKQMLIGQTINDVLLSNSPTLAMTVLADRNAGSSLIGAGISANEWLPVFKAVMTAVAITLIPFLVIFLPTPLAKKALYLICGLFVYLTAWGVIDAICHSMAMDYAMNLLSGIITQKQLGMISLNFFTTGPAQVLAVMGGMRWGGMVLAGAVSATFVGVGGSVMGSMMSQSTGIAQHAGSTAGTTVGTPEGMAKQLGESEIAPVTIANAAKFRYPDRLNAGMAQKFGATESGIDMVSNFGFGGATGVYRQMNTGKAMRFGSAGAAAEQYGLPATYSANTFGAGAQLQETAGMQAMFNNDPGALAGMKLAPQQVFNGIAASNNLTPAEQATAFAQMDTGSKNAFIGKFAGATGTDYMTGAQNLAGIMGAKQAYPAAEIKDIADSRHMSTDQLQADLAAVETKQDVFGKMAVGDLAKQLGNGNEDKGYGMLAGYALVNTRADFGTYGNSVASVEKALKTMKKRSYHEALGVAQAAGELHMSMGDMVQKNADYQAKQDFFNRTVVADFAKQLGNGNTNAGYRQLAQHALADTRADFGTYGSVDNMVGAFTLMKNLSYGDALGVAQTAAEAGVNPREFAQLTSNLRGQDVIGVAQGLKDGHFTKEDLRDAAFMKKVGEVFNEANTMAKGQAGDAHVPQSLYNADGTMNERMRLAWVDANAAALEKMVQLKGMGITSLNLGGSMGYSGSSDALGKPSGGPGQSALTAGASAGGNLQKQEQTTHDYIRARLFEISERAATLGQKDGSAYLSRETQSLYKDVKGELSSSWKWHKPVGTYMHDEVEALDARSTGGMNIPFIYGSGSTKNIN